MNDERGLTWYLYIHLHQLYITRDWYIHSNLSPPTKFTDGSSRSTEFKHILPWIISEMIIKTPYQHKNSNKLCSERGHTVLSLTKLMETVATTWAELPNEMKTTEEQILVSKERKKEIQISRIAGVSIKDPSRTVS